MVLEESSTDASSDFSSDQPSPRLDADPYAKYDASDPSSQFPGIFRYEINPGPLSRPYLAPYLRGTDNVIARTITYRLALMSQLTKRQLTSTEAQAVAEHASKATALAIDLFPLGPIAGLLRAYVTRSTFRFPMYLPRMTTFNPDRFWRLEGPMARYAWHGVRGSIYGFVGVLFGTFFASSYGLSIAAAHERRDPRLRQLNWEVQNFIRSQSRRREPLPRPPPSSTMTEDGAGRPYGDEASPQAMDEANDDATLATTTENGMNDYDAGMMSDDQMRAQESRRQQRQHQQDVSSASRARRRAAQSKSSEEEMYSARSLDDSLGFPAEESMTKNIDDHPTGARYDPTSSPPSSSSSSYESSSAANEGESAWDRIRRQSTGDSSSDQSYPFSPSSSSSSSSSPDDRKSGEVGGGSVWAQRRRKALHHNENDDGDSNERAT